jgi:tRNA pseudouridine38-40 synthase
VTEPVVPSTGDGGLVRLRLDLRYDGTDFSGWAVQPGFRTVQGVLEDALGQVLRLEVAPRATVAGRTDAGVHARHQVCHVDVPRAALDRTGRASLLRRLAGVLPEDVAILAAAPAPEGFEARFSALWRRYAYRVADRPSLVDPLRRREVLRYPRPLDVERMHRSAQPMLGDHDFAAFCRRREGASTVRTLLDLSWGRDDSGLVVAQVRADAFCHSMVRALVGSMLPVGEGRRPVGWPAEVLLGRVRDPAVTVAPARGLTLEEVAYPPDADLATRAVQSRHFRG